MAFTLGTNIENALYRVSVTMVDVYNERVKKFSELANIYDANDDGIQEAYQVLELISEAAFASASASLAAGVTGEKTMATNALQHHFIAHNLVLGFQRGHPDNATKIITNSFVIPAFDAALVDANLRPVMTRGVTFAAATNDAERLGALVDWLEGALIFRNGITDAVTVGGWTYAEGRSGVMTAPRALDTNPNT